jgi:NAD(P)-dependent dehydrogenase (short-subunit alcohol dehydrogenase family)
MTGQVTGSTAVVIGGTSGIGLAAAAALQAAGAAVRITGRDPGRLQAALATLGPRAAGEAVDAADEPALAAFFDRIGAFDHLVVAAGGGAAEGPFAGITEARFRAAFDAKFWAHLRCLRLTLGKVRRSVTLVTGAAGRVSFAGLSGLAATNGALEAMVGPLALEFAPVRVNAVSPGLIDTPYWAKLPEETRRAMLANAAASLPVRRAGTAEDIAGAILFLADNGFTSGSVLACDGGVPHV